MKETWKFVLAIPSGLRYCRQAVVRTKGVLPFSLSLSLSSRFSLCCSGSNSHIASLKLEFRGVVVGARKNSDHLTSCAGKKAQVYLSLRLSFSLLLRFSLATPYV